MSTCKEASVSTNLALLVHGDDARRLPRAVVNDAIDRLVQHIRSCRHVQCTVFGSLEIDGLVLRMHACRHMCMHTAMHSCARKHTAINSSETSKGLRELPEAIQRVQIRRLAIPANKQKNRTKTSRDRNQKRRVVTGAVNFLAPCCRAHGEWLKYDGDHTGLYAEAKPTR